MRLHHQLFFSTSLTAALLLLPGLSAKVHADQRIAAERTVCVKTHLDFQGKSSLIHVFDSKSPSAGIELTVVENESDQSTGEERAANSTEAELHANIKELEQELAETRNNLRQQAEQDRQKLHKEQLLAIEKIKLSENPMRSDCETFVSQLREISKTRRIYSSADPVTMKLKQVPFEHIDLLIMEMADRTSLHNHVKLMLSEYEPEQLRKSFTKSFHEKPILIRVIVMHGWVEDVRPAIVAKLNSADGKLSPAWFQAAVELRDPALYPKLHNITTQSRYAIQFLGMLEMLQDYDLVHTVDVCWERAKDGQLSVNTSTFARTAASYGNVDALGLLIEQLVSNNSYFNDSSTYNARRTQVLRYVDYHGSNAELKKWYTTNKDRLVFDQFRKRFIVPKDF